MSRKDEYLDKFTHLEAAIDSGQVPPALTPMLKNMKAKLLAEKARYLAQWENAAGRTQIPGMGIIESYAEKTETPQPFFGTDIKSRNRIRVRISQASVDENTGKIYKEAVISETVMTEAQFGNIIGSQNRGMGEPVTQLIRNGESVEAYNPDNDASKENTLRTLRNSEKDPGIGYQLSKIRQALTEAHEEGRMKKAESSDLARDLSFTHGNMRSNAGFQVDQVSKMYAHKVAEAALTIHLDAGSLNRPLLKNERD